MANQQNCNSIRDNLAAYFAEQTEVTTLNDRCVITLPLKTLDDRYQDVYLDPKLGDYVLVYDGGNSAAELFTQGIHPTDKQTSLFKAIARRYGATFNAGIFQIACAPQDSVEDAIFAVAQCASLAMIEVASHQPLVEDEPLVARVGRALAKWKPEYVDIQRNYKFRGTRAEHSFDFVSFTRRRGTRNVAVELLAPTGGNPRAQAERYGFLALDSERRAPGKWPRIAIVSRVEEWTPPALELVTSLSTEVIRLETDHDERVEILLPSLMTNLTEAA